MTPALNIGIFYDTLSGNISKIMNPDFEEEIDNHALSPGEAMIRMPKVTYGISFTSNTMTLSDVQAILATVQPPPPNV